MKDHVPIRVLGRSQTDILEAGDGNDVLTAGTGNNELHGDAGNDLIRGGSGVDDNTITVALTA